MNRRLWIAAILFCTLLCTLAAESRAASIVCVKRSGKCYFFQTLDCQAVYPNPGDTCQQVRYAGFHRVRGLKIDSKSLSIAQAVLRLRKIEFFLARPPREQGKLLILMDDLAVTGAADALKKAGVAATVEPIPQGPMR
jgi:hypothetical protein